MYIKRLKLLRYTISLIFLFLLSIGQVRAKSVSDVSTITSNAKLGEHSNPTVSFTLNEDLYEGGVIRIIFDPKTHEFENIEAVEFKDISFKGANLVRACTGALEEIIFSATSDRIVFFVCEDDVIKAGEKEIKFGGNKIVNPASVGAYEIRVQIGTSLEDASKESSGLGEPEGVTQEAAEFEQKTYLTFSQRVYVWLLSVIIFVIKRWVWFLIAFVIFILYRKRKKKLKKTRRKSQKKHLVLNKS